MDTKQFCKRHGIKAKVKHGVSARVLEQSTMDVDNMNHYTVTLTRREDGKTKRMTVPFFQGYGIEHDPRAEDVLDCLASDAAGVENARSFEDWCSEYGYDTDSRTAERIYKACEKLAEKLKNFMGSFYDSLLWDVKRL